MEHILFFNMGYLFNKNYVVFQYLQLNYLKFINKFFYIMLFKNLKNIYIENYQNISTLIL